MREILLIEDDRGLSDGIVLRMLKFPYRLKQVFSMEDTSEHILYRGYSLVILDLDFSGGKGRELMRRIRKIRETPVLMLMGKEDRLNQEEGYELGADDCIVKPFRFVQLLEKIENVLKEHVHEPVKEYRFRNLCFQFDDNLYFRDTEEIYLTDTEKKLLRLLVENENTALSAGLLESTLWKENDWDHPELKALIRSLREKLEEDPKRPRFLHTVYGRGYTWKERKEREVL